MEGSPLRWGAAPCPLWHGLDWVLLAQTCLGATLVGQGQLQLKPSLVAGLCCPASSFYPGFDVCHTGWSLFICLLGFPCCAPLRLVPVLRCSHSLALALPHFPPSSSVGPFSYQGCFLPAPCKITSLFAAAGLGLRCPADSILAAQWQLMLFTPCCISHLASHRRLCGRSQELSGSQAMTCSHCWGKSFAHVSARAECEEPEGPLVMPGHLAK